MSKTDSLHYQLCCEGAEWLRKHDYGSYKIVAVELVCIGAENPDVWGLLEWKDGEISTAKEATNIPCENHGELSILCSIMRREGVRKGIFNYRKRHEKDKV